MDATTRAAQLVLRSPQWDGVLQLLREEGFTKIASVRATRELLDVPLTDAKRRVHESPAWADRRAGDEAFHDSVLTVLDSEPLRPASSSSVDWAELWTRVALELAGHVGRGNLSLLTEDSIRWATAVWIQRLGVSPDRLHVEVPAARSGRIDLVVNSDVAAIEFKFPRPPRSGTSPLTQHAGAILSDLIRTAGETRYARRFVVVVLLPAFERHLSRRKDVPLPLETGAVIELDEAGIATLPETARRQLPPDLEVLLPVRVRCAVACRFEAFTLVAYDVGASDRSAA